MMDQLEWIQLNGRDGVSAPSDLSVADRLQWARESLVELDFELVLVLTDKVLRSEPTADQRAEAERLHASANRLLDLLYGQISGDRETPRTGGSLIS